MRELEKDRNNVSIQWRCFVDDLDFGLDVNRSALELETVENHGLEEKQESRVTLRSDRGWQSTGVIVQPGKSIEVRAEGRIVVREFENGKKWSSEPQGITVEYYRGKPLGCLIGVLASFEDEQPTSRWETVRIGKGTVLKATKKSLLLLKTNEPSRDLADNQGTFSVSIRKAAESVE
jgi:hypothetical protein